MKKCETMEDVRREIDRLDRQIVPLLLERLHYISEAGHIKVDRQRVRDEARVEDVVEKALNAAREHNGNTDFIETIYRHMIETCIQFEYGVWDTVNKK